ncbi:MAG: sugar transferase [Bdellovibrio sp.]|nr:sugar transferase [Bdellovibrio sp.]
MEKIQVRHTIWLKFFFLATFPVVHYLIIKQQLITLQAEVNTVEQVLSGIVFGIFAMVILQFFQMPRALRLSPRKSDLIVFAISFFIADVLARFILSISFASSFFSIWVISSRSIALAGLWFVTQFILARILKTLGYRIHLGLFATQTELNYVQHAVRGYETEKILDIELADSSNDKNFDIVAYSKDFLTTETREYHLLQLTLRGVPVIDMRDLVEEFDSHIDLDRSNTSDILGWAQNLPLSVKMYIRIKNFVEPILAAILLVLLAPILLITAMLVKISSKGPVLFTQNRLGQGGRPFTIFKFRTMRMDAEVAGIQWAQENDPRITRMGNILRKLHIDELPQLLNIVRGDLSFVGPRPERPEFYEKLKSEIPLFYMRTAIRPGLTGWAQVCAGYASSIQDSKIKLSYDLHYIKNMSLRMDVISSVMTVVHICNKFFWGENSLHRNAILKRPSTNVMRSSLFIFVMITLFTMSISAIAFGKY